MCIGGRFLVFVYVNYSNEMWGHVKEMQNYHKIMKLYKKYTKKNYKTKNKTKYVIM